VSPGRELNPEERLDWLRLIRTEQVGRVTFFQLLQRFGSASAALEALPALARRGGRDRGIVLFPRAQAQREIAEIDRLGGRLVAWGEALYPKALATLDDAPPLLTVLGRAELLQRPAVAVVGARNASASGRRFARDLAAELGRGGLVVVSGMARGIDAAAHEGALAAGTGTAAVVAGGADVVYPAENEGLYRRIVEEGVVVAELPVGTEPQARHFPRRNRIISGASLGTVVVEAALRSGSLITARFALEQGREVFAVPGSPLDPRCRGANDLIRQGATLTESATDVIEHLRGAAGAFLAERAAPRFTAPAPVPPSDSEVGTARAQVVELLGPTPVAVDELVRQCQLSAAVVATVLLELELAGRLERHPGNRVSLL
jgi:DNA processing protein